MNHEKTNCLVRCTTRRVYTSIRANRISTRRAVACSARAPHGRSDPGVDEASAGSRRPCGLACCPRRSGVVRSAQRNEELKLAASPPMSIYVETRVRGDLEELWQRT